MLIDCLTVQMDVVLRLTQIPDEFWYGINKRVGIDQRQCRRDVDGAGRVVETPLHRVQESRRVVACLRERPGERMQRLFVEVCSLKQAFRRTSLVGAWLPMPPQVRTRNEKPLH